VESRLADKKRRDEIMKKLEVERSVSSAARTEHEEKAAELGAREEAARFERQREANAQASHGDLWGRP